jgi:hypothetical protein
MTPTMTARDLPYNAMVRVARVASQIEWAILITSPDHIRKTHRQQLLDRELEESHEHERNWNNYKKAKSLVPH